MDSALVTNMVTGFFGEFLGMAIFIFIGCYSSAQYGAYLGHYSCLIWGLGLLTVAQIFGHISGGHVNMAVTLAAYLMDQIDAILIPVYIVAQITGAFAGFTILTAIVPTTVMVIQDVNVNVSSSITGFCTTVPISDITVAQALGIEFFATSILILALCACWDGRNAHNTDSLPMRLGFLIAGLFLIAGPYTGGSLNSIRTLIPAIFSDAPQAWKLHWVYWVAPNLAGLIWPFLYKLYDLYIRGAYLDDDEGEIVETRDIAIQTSKPYTPQKRPIRQNR